MRRLIVDNLAETRQVYGNTTCDFLGIVYLVTNEITKEVYVGQTVNGLVERWRNHCNSEKSTMFPIIAQYGSANFSIKILDICYSFKDLNRAETGIELELRSMSCDSRFDPRLISATCKGKRKSHRRYAWRYK